MKPTLPKVPEPQIRSTPLDLEPVVGTSAVVQVIETRRHIIHRFDWHLILWALAPVILAVGTVVVWLR